jgi:hypothetical protein
LGSAGLSLVLLRSPGSSGLSCALLLGSPESSWALLGSPGLSLVLLNFLGYLGLSWGFLGYLELSWALPGSPGLFWALLGSSGLSRALLGSPGPSERELMMIEVSARFRQKFVKLTHGSLMVHSWFTHGQGAASDGMETHSSQKWRCQGLCFWHACGSANCSFLFRAYDRHDRIFLNAFFPYWSICNSSQRRVTK